MTAVRGCICVSESHTSASAVSPPVLFGSGSDRDDGTPSAGRHPCYFLCADADKAAVLI